MSITLASAIAGKHNGQVTPIVVVHLQVTELHQGPCMGIADILVGLFGLYIAVGVLFAIVFVSVGVSRVDPAAKGGPIGFRLMILPGAAALWPMMLMKWLGRKGGDDHAA